MATKQLKASIILGGSLSASLRGAFGDTKKLIGGIAQATDNARRRQKLLGDAIQKFGRTTTRDLSGVRSQYARVTSQVERLTRAQNRLTRAEERHAKLTAVAGRMRSAGYTASFAGAAGLAGVMVGVREAKDWQTEAARIANLGLGDKVNAQAMAYARGLKTFGTSQVENLTLTRDALSVFGDLHHAQMAVPTLAKMKFGNAAFYGGEQGADNEAKFLDMLKVIELRGGTKSEEEFKKQANMVQKVISATGGRVGPEEWRHLIATGGLAAKSMRDDAFFYQLEPLVQEMGGDRVGTGLMTAYNSLYQGHISKRAANNLAKFGLIADASKVKHDKSGQVSFLDPGALKGADLFRQSQYEWMKQVLIPTLASKGITTKEQVLDAIGMMFSSRKGADLMAAMYLQQQQIDKNEHLNRGAADIDTMDKAGRGTAAGKELRARQAYEDAKLRFGNAALPMYTSLLTKAAGALEALNGFMDRNPKLAKALAVGFTVVAGSLAVIGPLLVGISSTLGAYAGYQLLMAKFGATMASTAARSTLFGRAITGLGGALKWLGRGVLTIGRALLTSPLFWIGAAIAGVAYEIYRHWGAVKRFFGRLWGDLKSIFSGGIAVISGILTGDFGKAAEGVKQIFRGLKEFVGDIFGGIADGIATVVTDALSAMGLISDAKQNLSPAAVAKDAGAALSDPSMLMSGDPYGYAAWVGEGGEADPKKTEPKPLTFTVKPAGSAPAKPRPMPAIPSIAAPAPAQPTKVEHNTENHYHITQQPGESNDDLARRIAKHQQQQQRGALYDKADDE